MYQKAARVFDRSESIVSEESGFSLIDLLFCLTLFSILLGFALPAYQQMMIETRVSLLSERLGSAMRYARSEAIVRSSVVVMCPSTDGKACTEQWRDGWIIFWGRYSKNPLENTLLRVYPALDSSEHLVWHGAGGRDYVQLNADGSAYGHNGSFVVCVKILSTNVARRVSLSQTGNIKLAKQWDTRICRDEVRQ